MNANFTSIIIIFTERGLELGVLQDNADLLKSQNVSLNEEAQALSLQMEVCLTMKTLLVSTN